MEQPSHCLNCGTELRGPYCHACGQPVKGMVRHLRSILHDFLDTVFEYDSRIWRSLIPLYFRPGRITGEFLDGKRIRFVLPFRLFFVLTVVAFLVVQWLADPVIQTVPLAVDAVTRADTVEEVEARQAQALARLEEALARTEEGAPAAQVLIDQRELLTRTVEQRLEWLRAAREARAEGREPPPESSPGLVFNGERWNLQDNPLEFSWLPDGANAQLNEWIARAEANLQRAAEEPAWLLDSFLGLLPAALFVLMPVFALLLKIFYVRKHWLYTAHLVVALHSHSFLSLAMLVSVLLGSLEEALHGLPWLARPAGFANTVSELWTPLYLLLMQRRVYAQGWPKTILKFCIIGTIYLLLLAFTALAVAAIALVIA